MPPPRLHVWHVMWGRSALWLSLTFSPYFSRSVEATASSSRRLVGGHSAEAMASMAYTCSFFFRICSYAAPRAWCLALAM